MDNINQFLSVSATKAIYLPPELFDIIIGHFHSDKATLAACSLVCKSWLLPSRRHLFSTIELSHWDHDDALPFSQLLSTRSTTLVFIRRLKIINTLGGFAGHWIDEVIPSLTGLQMVTSIHLEAGHSPMFAETRRCLSSFRMLKSLELFQTWFHDFAEVIDLICSFQSLETLVLSGQWGMGTPQNIDRYRLPRRLRTLDLACSTQHVLNWLLAHDSVPIIPFFSPRNIAMSEIPCIMEYLQVIGPASRHLAFNFQGNGTATEFCRKIDLTRHTELRSINVDFCGDKNVISLIRDILSQINSRHMEAVKLSFHSEDLDTPAWTHLNGILAQPQFSHLRRIELDVGSHLDDHIRKRLPAAHARGILCVTGDRAPFGLIASLTLDQA